ATGGSKMKQGIRWMAIAVMAIGGAGAVRAASVEDLARQAREAEVGFAASMARRDLNAFASFVSEEAVFFGGQGVRRGRSAVVEGWKKLFDGPKAPFSWEPEQVEVLDSGSLALSSGPVRDTDGRRIGTYNSIWRLESDGKWKIIFDKGCPPCDAGPRP